MTVSPAPTPAPTPTPSPAPPSAARGYGSRSRDRAARALRCCPFGLPFFLALRDRGVPLAEVVGAAGRDRGFSQRPLGELAADSALLWLIQVGVLRREVDGQGITDSFRLTPLGSDLITLWEQTGPRWSRPRPGDRLGNFIQRWGRLPL